MRSRSFTRADSAARPILALRDLHWLAHALSCFLRARFVSRIACLSFGRISRWRSRAAWRSARRRWGAVVLGQANHGIEGRASSGAFFSGPGRDQAGTRRVPGTALALLDRMQPGDRPAVGTLGRRASAVQLREQLASLDAFAAAQEHRCSRSVRSSAALEIGESLIALRSASERTCVRRCAAVVCPTMNRSPLGAGSGSTCACAAPSAARAREAREDHRPWSREGGPRG